MNVYICGKIGVKSCSEKTLKKFNSAKLRLEKKGHVVFNPTEPEWLEHLAKQFEKDKSYSYSRFPDYKAYCLLRNLMALATCDAIYVLPDWSQSSNAFAEIQFAMAIGLKVYYHPLDFE